MSKGGTQKIRGCFVENSGIAVLREDRQEKLEKHSGLHGQDLGLLLSVCVYLCGCINHDVGTQVCAAEKYGASFCQINIYLHIIRAAIVFLNIFAVAN